MIIKRQKEFGAIKAANKAAKRAWVESKAGYAGGFFGIGKKSEDAAIKVGREKIDKELVKTGRNGVWKIEKGVPCQSVPNEESKIKSLNQKINLKGGKEEKWLRDYKGKAISPAKGRDRLITETNLKDRSKKFYTEEARIRTINAKKIK